jgi:predicted transcriptional regulator of viral defense system
MPRAPDTFARAGRVSARIGLQLDRGGDVGDASGGEASGGEAAGDALIGALAGRQHGVVELCQLRAGGMSMKMVRLRIRRGSLHRIHRGVYSVVPPPLSREARWMAAVLACGEGAVLSHGAAAALWGIRAAAPWIVDVTSARRRGYSQSGIEVHRATRITPADRETRLGIPVTALPRTIVDLATQVPFGALEYAIHRAEARRKLRLADLHRLLLRLGPAAGTGPVRTILSRPHHHLDARTRGPKELRFLEILRAFDVPDPRVNEWLAVDNAAGGLEVDFHWPDVRLVVEIDERASHETLRALRNDPERDAALRRAGWHPLRVGEDELDDPRRVAGRVRAGLRDARVVGAGPRYVCAGRVGAR